MKLEKVKNALESTGLPVVYRAWPEGEAPALPYICYLVTGSSNFAADGQVYEKILRLQVELYTKFKDEVLEDKVEQALSSFVWEATEEYIDSEKCYQILYEIEV